MFPFNLFRRKIPQNSNIELILYEELYKSIPILSTDEAIQYSNNVEIRKYLKKLNTIISKKYGELAVCLLLPRKGKIYAGVFDTMQRELFFGNINKIDPII